MFNIKALLGAAIIGIAGLTATPSMAGNAGIQFGFYGPNGAIIFGTPQHHVKPTHSFRDHRPHRDFHGHRGYRNNHGDYHRGKPHRVRALPPHRAKRRLLRAGYANARLIAERPHAYVFKSHTYDGRFYRVVVNKHNGRIVRSVPLYRHW